MRKLTCFTLLISVALASVPAVAFDPVAHSEEAHCDAGKSAAKAALVGGALGGLLGGKHNWGAGTAIGAALGGAIGGIGCLSFESKVARQRSNRDIQQAYAGQLSSAEGPVVLAYESRPVAPTFRDNQMIVILSHIVVSRPSSGGPVPVQEQYQLTTPDGHQRTFAKEVAQDGGELTNEVSFSLPAAMPKGVYRVESELMIGGKQMSKSSSEFRLA